MKSCINVNQKIMGNLIIYRHWETTGMNTKNRNVYKSSEIPNLWTKREDGINKY